MNNRSRARSFDWMSLLTGILFILVAILTFQSPETGLRGLVIYYATTAIISGIFSLFVRNRVRQLTDGRITTVLVFGILEILMGVILLFNLDFGILTLAYMFALWFIIDSVRNLFVLDEIRSISKPYFWFSLILNVLGIIVGLSLFFDPIISVLTLSFLIGFYLMMTGNLYIVHAFMREN